MSELFKYEANIAGGNVTIEHNDPDVYLSLIQHLQQYKPPIGTKQNKKFEQAFGEEQLKNFKEKKLKAFKRGFALTPVNKSLYAYVDTFTRVDGIKEPVPTTIQIHKHNEHRARGVEFRYCASNETLIIRSVRGRPGTHGGMMKVFYDSNRRVKNPPGERIYEIEIQDGRPVHIYVDAAKLMRLQNS